MRIAVLDLGTNTFNLLIAERAADAPFRTIYNHKLPVKIGQGGINKRYITPEAMGRAMQAIESHMAEVHRFGVREVLAYGTSALRNASNGSEIVRLIEQRFGFRVLVIDGQAEAGLIFEGVVAALPLEAPSLVLDIGGGSNEFILGDTTGILWQRSFELGMARLIDRFPPSDPISTDEVTQMREYIAEALLPLYEQVTIYKPRVLIGASGSFESFTLMINYLKNPDYLPDAISAHERIGLADFEALYHQLITSTTAERLAMSGLEPMRVEMIVAAAIFVKFVLERTGIRELFFSDYSLKEGAAARYFRGLEG